jgi:hypothetical protein
VRGWEGEREREREREKKKVEEEEEEEEKNIYKGIPINTCTLQTYRKQGIHCRLACEKESSLKMK